MYVIALFIVCIPITNFSTKLTTCLSFSLSVSGVFFILPRRDWGTIVKKNPYLHLIRSRKGIIIKQAQILHIVIEEAPFTTARISSSVHYWAEGVGRAGWKINRRDTLRELNEATIGDEIQCVYSLEQLKKWATRDCIKWSKCKSWDALAEALRHFLQKNTQFPLVSPHPKHKANKINYTEFPTCHYFLFSDQQKKHVQKIITSLIQTCLITICWNDNLHTTSDV